MLFLVQPDSFDNDLGIPPTNFRYLFFVFCARIYVDLYHFTKSLGHRFNQVMFRNRFFGGQAVLTSGGFIG